ncbi:LapA family protein [Pseudonocardia sp. T1-2H]|uniref:LapA family protein n=1 Tax=Pseudonocardia sp. T1-2H TaxID=3128899 RepID=UPI003100B3EC
MNSVNGTAAAPGASDQAPRPTHRALAFCRQYWWLFTAIVVGTHVIAWALSNSESQTVHWIFFTTHSSLGQVIAVAVILGAIFGHLIGYQRRSSRQKTRTQASPTSGGPQGQAPA